VPRSKTLRGRETHRRGKQRYRAALRSRVLDLLGNACLDCGNIDHRVLQIEHVNGDGAAHRAQFTSRERLYRHILSRAGDVPDMTLRCANCHVIKTRQNGEYISPQIVPGQMELIPEPESMRVKVPYRGPGAPGGPLRGGGGASSEG